MIKELWESLCEVSDALQKSEEAFVHAQQYVRDEINNIIHESVCGNQNKAFELLRNLRDELTTDLIIEEETLGKNTNKIININCNKCVENIKEPNRTATNERV